MKFSTKFYHELSNLEISYLIIYNLEKLEINIFWHTIHPILYSNFSWNFVEFAETLWNSMILSLKFQAIFHILKFHFLRGGGEIIIILWDGYFPIVGEGRYIFLSGSEKQWKGGGRLPHLSWGLWFWTIIVEEKRKCIIIFRTIFS